MAIKRLDEAVTRSGTRLLLQLVLQLMVIITSTEACIGGGGGGAGGGGQCCSTSQCVQKPPCASSRFASFTQFWNDRDELNVVAKCWKGF
uniref:Uncharacterized protein n=1 Tax=Setaria digitata TaxID=48799 RepID=A0A915Q5I8_9BILA